MNAATASAASQFVLEDRRFFMVLQMQLTNGVSVSREQFLVFWLAASKDGFQVLEARFHGALAVKST
jgi:hypothetical protein